MIMNGLSNPNKKIFRPDKAIHIARKSSQKKKRKKKAIAREILVLIVYYKLN